MHVKRSNVDFTIATLYIFLNLDGGAQISDVRANAPPCSPLATPLLLASNNICLCFQKSSDMLNKNTLGVKKVRGQSEAALQTGTTKNFDIS